jgi:hypothetical protein
MELSKKQLLQIDNYVVVCGIKYYDVRTEIVDHFATILEKRLDENPDLSFKTEIENIHKDFSDRGFSKLLEEKTKAVKKRFYKQSLQHLTTFFKLPKIIITGIFIVSLFFAMNYVDDKDTLFAILGFVLIFLVFRLLFNVNIRDTKKESFLVLNMTMHFFNVFYLFVAIFNFFSGIGGSESLLNGTHNSIQLGVFALLLLFYWSGEYVYYQNKKLIKEQYSNILV